MKRMTLKAGILLFGLALCTSENLIAQDNKDRPKERPTTEQLFKDLDKNEDGKLSEKEVKGPLKEHFSKVDADEDGFITKEELEKAPKPKGRKEE